MTQAVPTLFANATSATGTQLDADFAYLLSNFPTTNVLAASTAYRGSGRGTPATAIGTGGVSIGGSNVIVSGLYMSSASAIQLLYPSTAATDIAVRDVELVSTSAASPNGIGIHVSQASSHRWSTIGHNINVYNYGVLTAGSSKGLIVANGFITVENGDAVEINSPGTSFEDVVVTGNVTKVTAGAGISAGFAMGIAHANGVVVANNISQRSYLEADHIEDGSKNVIVIGNIRKDCLGDGFHHLIDGASSASSKPAIVMGNTYEATAIVAGKAGIHALYTGTGTPQYDTIVGNVVRNFESGLWLGALSTYFADGNVIDSCTYAIRCETSARVSGTNMVMNTPTLLYASDTVATDIRVGKFICDAKPTNLILKTAPGTTRPGCSIAGFSWPAPNTALANGANNVNLFAIGTRMSGKITVIATNQAVQTDNAWYTSDLIWDGATLTLSDSIFEANGNLALAVAPTLNASGGQLRIGYTATGAMAVLIELNFDGIYMV